MNAAIRPTHFDREARTASAIATTVTGFSSAATALKAGLMPAGIPVDQLALRQFTRGGVMTAMSFISAAGNTYAAVNDFKQGHHVKGFLRAMSAAGSAANVIHAVSGGRAMAAMAVPGLFIAAGCGVVAKVMDQSH